FTDRTRDRCARASRGNALELAERLRTGARVLVQDCLGAQELVHLRVDQRVLETSRAERLARELAVAQVQRGGGLPAELIPPAQGPTAVARSHIAGLEDDGREGRAGRIPGRRRRARRALAAGGRGAAVDPPPDEREA